MLKLKLAAVTAAVVLVGLTTANGAQAAYEDPVVSVQVPDTTSVEGKTLTVTASSEADCAWAISFNGAVEEDNGTDASATFTTPQVDKRTNYDLVIRCQYDDTKPISAPVDLAPNVVTPAAIQTVTRTVTITVLPTGDAGDGAPGDVRGDIGALPDTGGTNAQFLWIGGALVVGGAAVTIVASRRRARA